MKKTFTSIPDTDFQEIYSWLLYFQKNFDNAAESVSGALDGIATAYIAEQKRLYNRDLTMEQAVSVLSIPPRNPRKAGRHATVTENQKAAMRDALAAGQKPGDIAREHSVSESYVRKLQKGIIK